MWQPLQTTKTICVSRIALRVAYFVISYQYSNSVNVFTEETYGTKLLY